MMIRVLSFLAGCTLWFIAFWLFFALILIVSPPHPNGMDVKGAWITGILFVVCAVLGGKAFYKIFQPSTVASVTTSASGWMGQGAAWALFIAGAFLFLSSCLLWMGRPLEGWAVLAIWTLVLTGVPWLIAAYLVAPAYTRLPFKAGGIAVVSLLVISYFYGPHRKPFKPTSPSSPSTPETP